VKILVIEDDKFIRENIIDILQFNGYEAQGASNGELGIQVAHVIQPDVILCDVTMEGIDGYGVLSAIRGDPELNGVPFLFVTAMADKKAMRNGMRAGADDYLVKPFTPEELLDAIEARRLRQQAVVEDTDRRLGACSQQLIQRIVQELRNPLQSVSVLLETMLRQHKFLTPQELEDTLFTTHYGSRRLERLITQLSYVTQLEFNTLSQDCISLKGKRTNLYDILLASVDIAHGFALYSTGEEHQVTVSIGAPFEHMVHCCPDALRHALAELIANAIAASHAYGSVQLKVWRQGQTVWLSIADHGPGIPAEVTAVLVQITLQNKIGNANGLAMGLPLSAGIIHAHGGEVQFESEEGQGTQVFVSLPISAQ
jgi:two-component system, sensor histidine kinase and response regulator